MWLSSADCVVVDCVVVDCAVVDCAADNCVLLLPNNTQRECQAKRGVVEELTGCELQRMSQGYLSSN